MLSVIVTLTGRSMCNVNSFCENNDNNGKVYIYSFNSYCDINGEDYVQSKQLL